MEGSWLSGLAAALTPAGLPPIVLGLAVLTFISTLVGGLVALRAGKNLHYFFAFAAGSLIGVSFLDLLPEGLAIADETGLSRKWVFGAVVVAFFVYSLVERFFLTHHEHGDAHSPDAGGHGHIMGPVGAGSLIVHSFFDGAAIGAAFQVSSAIGLIVAAAVVLHDFTDGINTVTVMLRNRQQRQRTVLFLLLDAIAPVVGVAAASVVGLNTSVLPILLGFFTGEFLYIGAANLLPETYGHGGQYRMLMLLGAGMLLIGVLTHFLV